MVPVEAQACGRPVVALAEGGALESVVDGVTGVLVQDPSVEAFADGAARRVVAHVRPRRDPPPRRVLRQGPLPASSSRELVETARAAS